MLDRWVDTTTVVVVLWCCHLSLLTMAATPMTPFSCRDGRNTLDHAWHCKRHATLHCHCMTTAAAVVVVVVFSCSFCCPSWSLQSVASDKKATTAAVMTTMTMMPRWKQCVFVRLLVCASTAATCVFHVC